MWPLKVEIKRWWYSDRRNGARYYMIQMVDRSWTGTWFSKDSDIHNVYSRSRNDERNDVLTYDEYKALKK